MQFFPMRLSLMSFCHSTCTDELWDVVEELRDDASDAFRISSNVQIVPLYDAFEELVASMIFHCCLNLMWEIEVPLLPVQVASEFPGFVFQLPLEKKNEKEIEREEKKKQARKGEK